ncbi:MAG: S9 family peptidase, partial [Promethearchaeota archaeon]
MTIPIENIIKIPILADMDTDANCSNILYSSNATGLLQLYISPTDLSSKPKQLTYEKESVLGGRLSPKGDELVFPMDKGGNEISHLLLMPIKGGDTKQLTENPQRTMDISWHPREQEVSRSVITMMGCGIETINTKTEECYMLKEKIPPPMDLHYSHDGKWIAYTSIKSFADTEVSVINRNDPSDIIIYNIKQGSRDGNPSWAPNGKKIAIFSEGTGRGRVHIQEFQGEDNFMLELDGEQDANQYYGGLTWDSLGEKVFYLITKHSQTNLHVHSLNGGRAEPLPFPEGTVEKPLISKDGKNIVVMHSSMTSPYGIYLHEVGSNSISCLTSRDFNVDISLLAQNQSIWYESFDNLKIHGWFTPAVGALKPYPALIYPHGGPWGQTDDSWAFGMFVQACSQSGMAVLSPNFRGSTGYGAEFQNLDIGDPGGGDLEDIVYGAKWLKNKPE